MMKITQRWSSKFQVKPGSWVFVPTDDTVTYGNSIKVAIETRWVPPNFYYHLRDGGHVKALTSHLEHEFHIHLDICNFFGCINKSRITRCLKRYWSYNKARDIASESTVRDPSLPQKARYILPFGFVQSPIIASLCLSHSKLGRYLSGINKKPGFSVSIYMDDIIISSNNIGQLFFILEEIKMISERSKFPLNQKKEEGPATRITAFNIELSKGVLRLTDERLLAFKNAYQKSENLNVLSGIVGYVSTINKTQASEIS
ncbi:MAG: reverse transcriptase domain-containing protein [Candidatus Reddybacter sp.]